MHEESLPQREIVENMRRPLVMSPDEGLGHEAALRLLGWLVRAPGSGVALVVTFAGCSHGPAQCVLMSTPVR